MSETVPFFKNWKCLVFHEASAILFKILFLFYFNLWNVYEFPKNKKIIFEMFF